MASTLPVPPAVAADENPEPYDPAVVAPDPAPLPDVISDEEREAPSTAESEGVDWSYEEPDVPETPQELIREGALLPEEGGPMMNVYSLPSSGDAAEHAALIYTDVVNRETASGKWVDLVIPTLQETPGAFVAKANAITVAFPREMAGDSRVVYQTQGGELRSVLSGIGTSDASREPAAEDEASPVPDPIPSPSSSAEPSGEASVAPAPASPSPVDGVASDPSPRDQAQSFGGPISANRTGGRSVLYRDVRPAIDAEYIANDQGYKENIILKSSAADPALAWDIHAEGFTLRQDEYGQILIVGANGEVISGFALPIVRDSADTPREIYGGYQLSTLHDGNYTLALTLDPGWLTAATYPVIVDPGPASATKYPSRDTSVSSSNNSDYESDQGLWISSESGDKRRAFIKQDLSPLTNYGRLVYSAMLTIAPYNVSNCTPYNDIEARRVTSPNGWPNPPMTWNNQPDVDSGPGYAVNGSNGADGPNGNSFGKFELKDIYQHYIDLDQPFHWSPDGIRLAGGPK